MIATTTWEEGRRLSSRLRALADEIAEVRLDPGRTLLQRWPALRDESMRVEARLKAITRELADRQGFEVPPELAG